MVKYSIRVTPTMFVQHCSSGIFETTSADMRIFSREECRAIIERLKDRYIFNVILYGTDGSRESINSLKPNALVNVAPVYCNDDCFTL